MVQYKAFPIFSSYTKAMPIQDGYTHQKTNNKNQ